jgi:hypothetical protein
LGYFESPATITSLESKHHKKKSTKTRGWNRIFHKGLFHPLFNEYLTSVGRLAMSENPGPKKTKMKRHKSMDWFKGKS